MNEAQLIQLIEEATDSTQGSVSMESTSGDIAGWDSLGHLQILSMLREHFGEDYDEDPDLATATSAKEIFEIISR